MRISEIKISFKSISHAFILLGQTRIEPCFQNPVETYELNVSSILRLITDLFSLKIKPVFISSEYIFDGEKGTYQETDLINPKTKYGQQKAEVEEFLNNSSQDFLILRSPKVLGTKPGDGTLLTGWIDPILKNQKIQCADDQWFSATHVDDMVEGFILSVQKNLSGIYHLCAPHSLSRVDMAKALGESLGLKPHIEQCHINDIGLSEPRPHNISMNPKKFINATGHKFKTIQQCCEELAYELK